MKRVSKDTVTGVTIYSKEGQNLPMEKYAIEVERFDMLHLEGEWWIVTQVYVGQGKVHILCRRNGGDSAYDNMLVVNHQQVLIVK